MRLLAALFALLLALPAAAQDGRANTILVLDGSGSMWGQIDGVNKIVIARDVVDGLLQDFPADQNLGLTVYGHRTRGDCTDIETVVAPGPNTLGAISDAVNGINPRGKTPMTDAVIAAAEALRFTEEKATVILVSDGVETCNPDPCAAARALEQAGIDFTAHVVGFDVTDPEALAQMQCLAGETGGQFLTASNADELTDALTAVAAEPEPIVVDGTFRAIEGEDGPLITDPVFWTVTSDAGPLTEDEQGNPLELSLLEGTYRATAYRATTETELEATLTVAGPDPVTTTVVFPAPPPPPVEVTFSARIGAEDGPSITDPVIYSITPAPEGMEPEQTGNPLTVALPTGAYTVEAYWTAQEATQTRDFVVVDAARTLVLTFEEPAQTATLVAPATAPAGATIEVGWNGPDEEKDYLAVATPEEDGYVNYTYTSEGNPLRLQMPPEPGAFELRYIRSDGREVLGTRSIEITPLDVAVSGPSEAEIGAEVAIEWTGPDYEGDYLAVAVPGEDGYVNYTYTREGSPLTLQMPPEPGTYELRYFLSQDRTIVATAPITVSDVAVSLSAPAEAERGADVSVDWQGPDREGDYLAVAIPGEDGYINYTYTREGTPLQLQMPAEPGEYELRYILSQDRKVLATRPITVSDVTLSVSAPAEAVAGSTVPVDWVGPDYDGDYLAVADPGDSGYVNYVYTRDGTPGALQMPTEPGEYEIRYVFSQDREIAATTMITVTPLTATLDAAGNAPMGATIPVTWAGPDYDGDYLAVSRPDDSGYENYAYTRNGTPAELTMPVEPGEYEIRYVLGQDRSVAARRTITVDPIEVQVSHPATGPSGGTLTVDWDGPDYSGDYIAISRVGDDGYETYSYTRTGDPLEISLPDAPGEYEVRYILSQDRRVAARSALTVE